MRLAVIGGAGRIGSRIVAEALGRGHEVTAVVRDRSGLSGGPGEAVEPETVAKRAEADVFVPSSVARAVSGAEVVVNAAGHAAQLDDDSFYTRAARSVVAALRTLDPPPRLLVVGGFGSLRDPSGGQYADRPGLPPQAVPEIVGQRDALTYYRGVEDLHWTYVSPPPGGIAPGERTGTYLLARDTVGDREVSTTLVSMEDYAVAVVDEAERAEHRHACIVVMR
jgi:putative NADH-flavin reductase